MKHSFFQKAYMIMAFIAGILLLLLVCGLMIEGALYLNQFIDEKTTLTVGILIGLIASALSFLVSSILGNLKAKRDLDDLQKDKCSKCVCDKQIICEEHVPHLYV